MSNVTQIKTYLTTSLASLAIYGGVSIAALCSANTAFAADGAYETNAKIEHVMASHKTSGTFTKRTYGIQGDWEIVQRDGQNILRLGDSFRTKKGPDLKIFLSPSKLDGVTGRTATQGSIKLGALQSNKGAQEYVIPASVDLANFGSLLIHCEAFSKLWGGADL